MGNYQGGLLWIVQNCFPGVSSGKETACHVLEMQETWVQPLCQEDSLEKETAIHSTILAWEIPWTEEPGELQSMGCRVGHD